LYLILISILSVYAEALELKYYYVTNEFTADKEWSIKGSDGDYFCTAETSCEGFKDSDVIITGRAVWYDPIMVFYVKDGNKKRCMLKTCVRPIPLTYKDLKWDYQ